MQRNSRDVRVLRRAPLLSVNPGRSNFRRAEQGYRATGECLVLNGCDIYVDIVL